MNSFAYTSRELDAGNIYFYRARYYNPSLQRFVSEDIDSLPIRTQVPVSIDASESVVLPARIPVIAVQTTNFV